MSPSPLSGNHRVPVSSRRSLLRNAAVAGVAALTTGVLLGAPTASADDSSSAPASLTIRSDPGEFIGKGLDYDYARPFDQMFASLGFNGSAVHLAVYGLNGESWTLDFAAPDHQPLQVGSYPDAQGHPFMEAGHPGIQVHMGFTCSTITGSFDILELAYDENGLTRFRATFEQHCNNASAALTGEVVYTPQSPLPPLELTIDVDRLSALNAAGTFVRATGTITCNQYVFAGVSFDLRQDSTFAGGNGGVPCSPGATIPWTLYGEAQGDPFGPGLASASAYVSAKDGFAGTIETAQYAGRAVLRRGALE